jgi:predicted RNA binding protein YcfA (HicA-like mRNA interferase family)
MSRLRPLSPRKVKKILVKLGWKPVRITGSHEIYQHPDHSFIIVLPIHNEIKKGTLKSIIEDLGLSIEDFFNLI